MDSLREAGFRYVADWILDDEPCRFATATAMVSLPRPGLNELGMILIQGHRAAGMPTAPSTSRIKLLADFRRGHAGHLLHPPSLLVIVAPRGARRVRA